MLMKLKLMIIFKNYDDNDNEIIEISLENNEFSFCHIEINNEILIADKKKRKYFYIILNYNV